MSLRTSAGIPLPAHAIELLEVRRHLATTAAPSTNPTFPLGHATVSIAQARTGSGVAAVNDVAYVGGGGSSLHDLDSVETYNAANGQFGDIPPLPTAGRTVAIGVGHYVLFAGGGHGHRENAVDVFDTRTGAWSSRTFPLDLSRPAVASAGGKAVFVPANGRATTAAIFDAATGNWTVEPLPAKDTATDSFAAATGDLAIFDLGGRCAAYDAAADRWSLLPAKVQGSPLAAIGAQVAFNIGNGVALYDTITGEWRPVPPPPDLNLPGGGFYFTQGEQLALGDKLLIRGIPASADDPSGTSNLGVFDVSTAKWSIAADPTYRDNTAHTTIGSQALFAGGGPSEGAGTTAVDLFTDTAPTPVLSGTVAARRGTATVTVTNTGDADYGGPYVVQVYATPPHRLKGAVRLGSVTLNRDLAPGASVRVAVPLSVPAGVAAGTYHYVAAVAQASDPSHPTPVAGGTATFRLGGGGATASSAAVRPAAEVFSRVPLIDPAHRRNPLLD